MTQVTNTGKAELAAISPDGRYILSVQNENGQGALWLRNVPTNSDTQIIPASGAIFVSLAFSPDGNYIYFRKSADQTGTSFNLFRAPVLGGQPQQIVTDIDSDITFSPDGKRIAYFRGNDPVVGQFRMLSANLDGTDEKVLLVGNDSNPPQFASWSPDGKEIAYSVIETGQALGSIGLFDLASGKAHTMTSYDKDRIYEMHWMPSGRGLMVNYGERPLSRSQLGYVSYPQGVLSTITRDTNSYHTLTLSADATTGATVQIKTSHAVDVIPSTGTKETSPAAVLTDIPNANWASWADNHALLVSDGTSLLRSSLDGANRTTLASDPNGAVLQATTCGDKYVVFGWAFHGGGNVVRLWRVNADGSGMIPLTKGGVAFSPTCSPDGKSVYYNDPIGYSVLRVSIDGGEPEVVPGTKIPGEFISETAASVSPDGKELAFVTVKQPSGEHIQIVDLGAGSNPNRRTVEPDPRISSGAFFTPDGKGVAYAITENGTSNVWVQPLDGSRGRQITDFKTGTFRLLSWSPDGKSLVVDRSEVQSDVVLVKEGGQGNQ
jgi:eukaryotic-like serine/threonine-protein kinase